MTVAISPEGRDIGVRYTFVHPNLGKEVAKVRLACHGLHDWFVARPNDMPILDLVTLVPSLTSGKHGIPFSVDTNGDIW